MKESSLGKEIRDASYKKGQQWEVPVGELHEAAGAHPGLAQLILFVQVLDQRVLREASGNHKC